MSKNKINRRSFLKKLGIGTLGGILSTQLSAKETMASMPTPDKELEIVDSHLIIGDLRPLVGYSAGVIYMEPGELGGYVVPSNEAKLL